MKELIRPSRYFNDFISYQDESFKHFDNLRNIVVKQRGEDDKGVLTANIIILKHLLNKLWATFSIGGNSNTLKNEIKHLLPYLRKGWQGESGYVQMLWLLSISICLEIEDETFNQLVALVDKDGLNDQLLDYLIAYRIPNRKINEKLQFPKPYASLISATTWGKSIAQTTLKTYLEKKWYPGHSDCGWHDSHKSPHNTYFGYWSFEAAAIVKIMELDDFSFKDNQYYPYDLVHWKG